MGLDYINGIIEDLQGIELLPFSDRVDAIKNLLTVDPAVVTVSDAKHS